MDIPVLAFVGSSGCGKTTLLSKIIPMLRNSGLHVGVIKHTRHSPLETDVPGTDTRTFWDSGADSVMLAGGDRRVISHRHEQEPALDALLAEFTWNRHLDIIIIEGYKRCRYPKMEVIRMARDPKPLKGLENRIGVVTDHNDLPFAGCEVFPLDDYGAIAEFVIQYARTCTQQV